MAEIKTFVYDCIIVEKSVMPTLQDIGNQFKGSPLSRNAVLNALRYVSNSDVAKHIRKVALEMGGKKITKKTVKFV